MSLDNCAVHFHTQHRDIPPNCNTPHCTADSTSHRSTARCTPYMTLHYTIKLHFTTLHCTEAHLATLQSTAFTNVTLHNTTKLHYTTPHCTAHHCNLLTFTKKENDKGRLLFFNENEENHGEKNNKNNYCFKGRKTNQEGWKRVEKMLPKIVTNMHHAAACPTTYGCLSGFEYVLKWQNIKMFEWNEGRIQG